MNHSPVSPSSVMRSPNSCSSSRRACSKCGGGAIRARCAGSLSSYTCSSHGTSKFGPQRGGLPRDTLVTHCPRAGIARAILLDLAPFARDFCGHSTCCSKPHGSIESCSLVRPHGGRSRFVGAQLELLCGSTSGVRRDQRGTRRHRGRTARLLRRTNRVLRKRPLVRARSRALGVLPRRAATTGATTGTRRARAAGTAPGTRAASNCPSKASSSPRGARAVIGSRNDMQ